jgi:signal transduction histidine kinase
VCWRVRTMGSRCVGRQNGNVNSADPTSGAAGLAGRRREAQAVQDENQPLSGPPRRRGPARVLSAQFGRRVWAEVGYAVAGLPLAVAGFAVTVATLGFGIGYAITFVGLPLIAVGSILSRWLGAASRWLARRLLGLRVAAPPPLVTRPGFLGWMRSQLTDVVAWRARAYLLLKFPVALGSFLTAAVLWSVGVVYTLAPLAWALGAQHIMVKNGNGTRQSLMNIDYGPFYFNSWPRMWLLFGQGVIVLLIAPWAVRAVITVDRWLIASLLGPVSLTERVQNLEQTRAQAVDDSAARLRSIERDLHDGAQAQMVAVAMKLGLAREKLAAGPDTAGEPDVRRALELVETAQRTAREAINDLRDRARPGPDHARRAQRGAGGAGGGHPAAAVGGDRDHRLLLRRRAAGQRGQAQRRPARGGGGGARARPAPAAGQRRRQGRRADGRRQRAARAGRAGAHGGRPD